MLRLLHLSLVVKDTFHSFTCATQYDGGVNIKRIIYSIAVIWMKKNLRTMKHSKSINA